MFSLRSQSEFLSDSINSWCLPHSYGNSCCWWNSLCHQSQKFQHIE